MNIPQKNRKKLKYKKFEKLKFCIVRERIWFNMPIECSDVKILRNIPTPAITMEAFVSQLLIHSRCLSRRCIKLFLSTSNLLSEIIPLLVTKIHIFSFSVYDKSKTLDHCLARDD